MGCSVLNLSQKKILDVLNCLNAEGIAIKDLRWREATLEEVFIRLTAGPPRDPPCAALIPHVETHDMRLHDMRLHDMRLHGKPILRTRLENVSRGLPRPLRTS